MILRLHKTMLHLHKPMLNTSQFGSNRFVNTETVGFHEGPLPRRKRIRTRIKKDTSNKKVQFSTLMPPRDPRLHRSIVTPPCPINIGEMQTPVENKQYTHVRFLDLLLQFAYELCFSLHIVH